MPLEVSKEVGELRALSRKLRDVGPITRTALDQAAREAVARGRAALAGHSRSGRAASELAAVVGPSGVKIVFPDYLRHHPWWPLKDFPDDVAAKIGDQIEGELR